MEKEISEILSEEKEDLKKHTTELPDGSMTAEEVFCIFHPFFLYQGFDNLTFVSLHVKEPN